MATVADRRIAAGQVDERLDELRRGPRARHIPPDGPAGATDVRRWIVQELVTEAVLAHEARGAGFSDQAPSARLSVAEVARLVAHVTRDASVPESEMRAYYDRNRDLYARPEARRVRHAVVSHRRVADALVRDGEVRGELSEIRRGELAGPLEDEIFGADPGAVVGPIRTELGWHVARIEAVTAASVVPFPEARAAIEAELLLAARARAFDEWLDGRRRAIVAIEPGFEHPGHPSHGLPSHRH